MLTRVVLVHSPDDAPVTITRRHATQGARQYPQAGADGCHATRSHVREARADQCNAAADSGPTPAQPRSRACPGQAGSASRWRLRAPDRRIGLARTADYALPPGVAVADQYRCDPAERARGPVAIQQDQFQGHPVGLAEAKRRPSPVLGYHP